MDSRANLNKNSSIFIDMLVEKTTLMGLQAMHLKTLADSCHDAIICKKMDGTVTSWNKAAEKLFGYTAEEMIGRSSKITIPDSKANEEDLILERITNGHIVDHFETERIHKAQHSIFISVTISPIYDENHNIIGVSKIARDITRQVHEKNSIEEIKIQNKQLLDIIASSEDAVISRTIKGIVTSWNSAAERIFGYSADEVLDKPMITVYPDDRVNEEKFILDKVSRGEKIERFETVRVHKDGHKLNTSSNVSPILDNHGNIIGLTEVAQDITPRLIAELQRQTLSKYTQQLMAIVESSDDAIISKNLDGIVTSWNKGAEKVFGFLSHEMIGKPMTMVFPKNRLDEEKTILAKIASGEKVDHFETIRMHKSGHEIHVSATISPIMDDFGNVIGASKIARDISDKIESQKTLHHHANYDMLTSLPNRRLFMDRLGQEISKAKRSQLTVAIIFIDLDRFKVINDSLGHDNGDSLLIQIASRFKARLRACDTVARLGGDEFVVIASELKDIADAGVVAQSLLECFTDPFILENKNIYVTSSAGIACYPKDGSSIYDLIKHADQAMYEAKQNGRNRYQFYNAIMQVNADRYHEVRNALQSALENQEFEIYYQPIIHLASESITKAEALIRWHRPNGKLISPEEFIPIAEESGVIHKLGQFVYKKALEQLKIWQKLYGADFQVSINKSPIELFGEGADTHSIFAELDQASKYNKGIVIEITENMMMSQSPEALNVLLKLRDIGIEVAIDDFGTGYSSLSYLNKFDIDYLKIDKMFTANLTTQSNEQFLCEAIIAMAHKLGLKVIAEGVETTGQLQLLKEMQCDFVQGYLFSRALSPANFEKLMNVLQEAKNQSRQLE